MNDSLLPGIVANQRERREDKYGKPEHRVRPHPWHDITVLSGEPKCGCYNCVYWQEGHREDERTRDR